MTPARATPGFVLAACLPLLLAAACTRPFPAPDTLRIGSKNFSEQLVLGEILAQMCEHHGIRVERRFGFGTTTLIHGALTEEQIDLYVEYTGTGMHAILGKTGRFPLDAQLTELRREYQDRFRATWYEPLGFDNSYAVVVRAADAGNRGWTNISSLASAAPTLRAGFTTEFAERPDGYPNLRRSYGFTFGRAITLDAALMYPALRDRRVDVISGFLTDGRIDAYNLRALPDDRSFFPSYAAVPVVHLTAIVQFPNISLILQTLAGRIDTAAMRRMNFEVDERGATPAAVARAFLAGSGLLQDATPAVSDALAPPLSRTD